MFTASDMKEYLILVEINFTMLWKLWIDNFDKPKQCQPESPNQNHQNVDGGSLTPRKKAKNINRST